MAMATTATKVFALESMHYEKPTPEERGGFYIVLAVYQAC